MGKTYEIICKRRNNRIECNYRKQDPDLCCAECSFAAFILRKNQEKEQEMKKEDNEQ